ncbi:MAG TPA: hypothetical protein VFP54_01515 [Acidimicrobiales bacterium]|nr:hypothetical protein [Acidimicrobiales bacterium]
MTDDVGITTRSDSPDGQSLAERRSAVTRWIAAAGVGALVVLGVVGVTLGRGSDFGGAVAVGSGGGDLYFTTFKPGTLQKVTYRLEGGQIRFAAPQIIAHPGGADGTVFSPDGRLLVGGGDGQVYAVDAATGVSTAVRAGTTAFMLAVEPSGHVVYTAGLPGLLAAVPLRPLAAGRSVPLHGDDTLVTGMAFGPRGQAVYTTSPPAGRGSIGLIDLATGTTRRLFADVPAAHGIIYDPYTNSFLVMGGSTVFQLAGDDPSVILSEATVPATPIDQGAVDGHGHALLACNCGSVVYVDYSASHRIGDVTNTVSARHLVDNLDDVAPLVGPGAQPAPTLARWWRAVGGSSLVLAALIGIGFLVIAWRRRSAIGRLPRWDLRRQGGAAREDSGDRF